MFEKELANEDLKINASISVPPVPPDALYIGDFGITKLGVTAVKDLKVAAPDGKKVCVQSITFSWSLALGSPCPYTSVLFLFITGGGSINATSSKCLASNKAVHRKDDSGSCTGSWSNKAQPSVVVFCNCNMKISEPGQSKVKGI